MTQTLDAPARFPLHPPARFFDRPEWLDPGQKLAIVTDGPDAGRVAGYVATWDTCIIDGSDGCWSPPSSPTAYRGAMQGETLTAEGDLIPTANIGGGVNHARLSESFQGAVKHYDNAQPLWAKVLTPSGWRTMGSLRIGDRVVDPDGHESMVEGVYPRGEHELWCVTLGDGSTAYASADHLWRVLVQRKHGRAVEVITTEELAAKFGKRPIYLAAIEPHEGTSTIPLDPYVLGALLGDGGLSGRGIKFTCAESDIVQEIGWRLPDGAFLKDAGTDARPHEYRLVDMGTHVNKNRVAAALAALGVKGKRSHEKFIPADCFALPADGRLALLRGLMDTDGHASAEGQATFHTTSRALAYDVVALVRSLGGRATAKARRATTWTSPAQPEPQVGRPSFWVNVTLPHGQCPFLLERKVERYKHRTMFRGHRVVSVEATGIVEPVQCIRVSAPSHCYVTDDYMPTHNTAAQTLRVQFGEDEHGIWFAGAAWPELGAEREVAMLRAAAVSGDWRFRPELGAVDMAGVQLVNNPGLPLVRRMRAAALDGIVPEVYVGGLGGGVEFEPEPPAVTDADRLHDLEVVTAALIEAVGPERVRDLLDR